MIKASKKDKRRILFWALLILIVVSYLGVFTYNYWSKILINYQERESLEEEYQNLLSEEKKLSSEATKLLDPEYVAKFAREKFMYTKAGEKIIRIPEWLKLCLICDRIYLTGSSLVSTEYLKILFASGCYT